MKFLLEILGMTNYCNLRCSYCDWDFQPNYPRPLPPKDVATLARNLLALRRLMDDHFPEVRLVEYSGGEPFLYPEVVDGILATFPDRWVRVNTNGLLVDPSWLDRAAAHGKTYVALSLDGADDDANHTRFRGHAGHFAKVVAFADALVERGIPLLILCTLNEQNIGRFPFFIRYLEDVYAEAIAAGRLIVPAFSVSEFGRPMGRPAKGTCDALVDFVTREGHNHPLLRPIAEHYEHLARFMNRHEKTRVCTVFDWVVSTHFRHSQIVNEGTFLSFGCGMRGEWELGQFDINSPADRSRFAGAVTSPAVKELVTGPGTMTYQCREGCLVDWFAFDLVFAGIIPLKRASEWFVLFADPSVESFVSERLLRLITTSQVEESR